MTDLNSEQLGKPIRKHIRIEVELQASFRIEGDREEQVFSGSTNPLNTLVKTDDTSTVTNTARTTALRIWVLGDAGTANESTVTLTAGEAGNTPFAGSPFTPRVVNTNVYYNVVPCQLALPPGLEDQ